MKTYEGIRYPRLGKHEVVVHEETTDGIYRRTLEPDRSQAVVNHSSEFEWGYGGSGPAQLALAILLDVTGDEKVAEEWHQWFKWAFVTRFDRWAWVLREEEIQKWLFNQMTIGPVAERKSHERQAKVAAA